MDDQTEVPEQYVVLFLQREQEHASDPESYPDAKERAENLAAEDDIEVLSIMTEQGYQLRVAQSYRQTQQERISEDVDASLDEPAIGAFSTLPEEPTDEQLKDWEKDLEAETSEPASKGVALDSWSHKQNRHSALDHAMKLATMPMGGMMVATAGPTAEKVIENARLFLAFLNEEGTGA